MNVNLLIDAIIRQTTVLVAQLSTAAGLRAPLAHVANQVFLDLVSALEAQGVGRKVIADMFGLALRSYQLKVQRLSESSTLQNRSLWEAVYDFLQSRAMVTRADVLLHFRLDEESVVRSILHDLVESGLAFKSGRGHSTVYRAATEEELGHTATDSDLTAATLVWVAVYRHGPDTPDALCRIVGLEESLLRAALDGLVTEGRVVRQGDGAEARYSCKTMFIPMGEPAGWEAAVYDHYQAVVAALCAKLQRNDTRSLPHDVLGGSTWSFDVWDGHPYQQEVYALLRSTREQVGRLRREVTLHNDTHGRPEHGATRVIFYAGQNVVWDDEDHDEEAI